MLNWFVVHRKNKRLPPVAQAFKIFLMRDGAALIKQFVRLSPELEKQAARLSGKCANKSEVDKGWTSSKRESPMTPNRSNAVRWDGTLGSANKTDALGPVARRPPQR